MVVSESLRHELTRAKRFEATRTPRNTSPTRISFYEVAATAEEDWEKEVEAKERYFVAAEVKAVAATVERDWEDEEGEKGVAAKEAKKEHSEE